MKTRECIPIVFVVYALGAGACQRSDRAQPTDRMANPSQPQSRSKAPACEPLDKLAQLDRRTPLPLQPMMAWHQKQNMMQHLAAIEGIIDGLAKKDWRQVSEAAARIQSSPQMTMTCQHMGAGAPGFAELALEFHHRADTISAAAGAQDVAETLRATAHTLKSCTGCHAGFRQQVVSQAEWVRRTGQAQHSSMEHSVQTTSR